MSTESPVLVVEDDDALREVIEWALVDAGFAVVVAEHGAAALRVVEHVVPCVILLDMRMPVMDGWGFARAYLELPVPHAPVIVVTAARDAAEWAKQIEAADYLGKPFDIADLVETVRRHVGQPA